MPFATLQQKDHTEVVVWLPFNFFLPAIQNHLMALCVRKLNKRLYSNLMGNHVLVLNIEINMYKCSTYIQV